jgi:hypothetical protein
VRNGQFEDLEGEGARILFDDAPLPAPRIRGEGDSGHSGASRVSHRSDATGDASEAKR